MAHSENQRVTDHQKICPKDIKNTQITAKKRSIITKRSGVKNAKQIRRSDSAGSLAIQTKKTKHFLI